MLDDGFSIPLFKVHHEALLHTVESSDFVVLLFRLRHRIAELGVLAVANQAEVTE